MHILTESPSRTEDSELAGPDYAEIPEFSGYRLGKDGTIWTSSRSRSRPGDPKWRKMSSALDKDGYRKVLLQGRGRKRHVRLHRLMLEVFVGPCPRGLVAAHEDGDLANNGLENLRYKTQKENIRDKRRHGTQLEGENHPSSKLRADQVVEMRRLYDSGEERRTTRLGKMFNINPGSVWLIVHRKKWTCLG